MSSGIYTYTCTHVNVHTYAHTDMHIPLQRDPTDEGQFAENVCQAYIRQVFRHLTHVHVHTCAHTDMHIPLQRDPTDEGQFLENPFQAWEAGRQSFVCQNGEG